MTLRCTRKLLKELHAPATQCAPRSHTLLGDWYAGIYDARPQPVVLCLNERSLAAVLVAFGDSTGFISRFRDAVMALLTRIGVPRDLVVAEQRAMSDVAIRSTANRRVLGCLNEAVQAMSVNFDAMHERYFWEHEDYLGRFIYSTTEYRYPHQLALELFAAATNGRGN